MDNSLIGLNDINDNVSSHAATGNQRFMVSSILGIALMSDQAFFVRIVSPIILVISVTGNSATIAAVLLRKLYLKSAMFVFLAFISASDMCVVGSRNFADVLHMLGYWSPSHARCAAWHYVYTCTTTISVFSLTAVTILKCRAMYRPFDFMSTGSVKTALVTCLSIVVLVFSIKLLPLLSGLFTVEDLIPIKFDNTTIIVRECVYRTDWHYVSLAYTAFYTLTVVVIPGVILTGLSIAILIIVLRSYRQHKILTSVDESTSRNLFASAKSTATILVPLSVLHIVFTLPLATLIFLYHITELSTSARDMFSMYTSLYITRTVLTINHALNFYVQLVCSQFFRDAVLPCQSKPK